MAVNTHMTTSWIPIVGRQVAALFGAGVVLLGNYLLCMATGILQLRQVTIMTFEPYDPIRWSFHFLGATVEGSEPLFWLLCFVLLLPSLTVGVLVWRYFGRRWMGTVVSPPGVTLRL